MRRSCRSRWPFGALLVWAVATAAPQDFALLDDECEGDFCLRATLVGGVRADEARLTLCQQATGEAYHVVLRGGRLRVVKHTQAGEVPLADWRPVPASREGGCRLTVQRCAGEIRVLAGGQLAAVAHDASLTGGRTGTWASSPRAVWTDVRFQPMEPVYLTDDFMRAADYAGNWMPLSGRWSLEGIRGEPQPPPPDQTSNPFAYRGATDAEAPALSAVGYWFWTDYSVAVAVRPQSRGAIGLCAYVQDERNYLAFQWTAGLAEGSKRLVRVIEGAMTVLTEAPGGYERGQWYWLELRASGGEVAAFVDGREACRAGNTAFGLGRAGLLVSGKGAASLFDDVQIASRGASDRAAPFPTDTEVPKHYVGDEIMKRWTTQQWSWREGNGQPKTYWHHGRFFGDPTVSLPLASALPNGGRVGGIVCANAEDDQRGGTGWRSPAATRARRGRSSGMGSRLPP